MTTLASHLDLILELQLHLFAAAVTINISFKPTQWCAREVAIIRGEMNTCNQRVTSALLYCFRQRRLLGAWSLNAHYSLQSGDYTFGWMMTVLQCRCGVVPVVLHAWQMTEPQHIYTKYSHNPAKLSLSWYNLSQLRRFYSARFVPANTISDVFPIITCC